jgi:molybdenum cofactor synthesis domain
MSSRKKVFHYAIITASDTAAAGEREDLSAKVIRDLIEPLDYVLGSYTLLPDDRTMLEKQLMLLCDSVDAVDLILTTGGTGLSPRDCMPEATLAIADRQVPGIAEAVRANGARFTKRAMLSRGVAVIRKHTLIINLPGSPKAVEENLSFLVDQLDHALGILSGRDGDCARKD